MDILKSAGVVQPVVQIEKELFHRTIYAICPSYETPQFFNNQSHSDNNNNQLNNILTINHQHEHSTVYGRKAYQGESNFVRSI